jgi:hypothetical protein
VIVADRVGIGDRIECVERRSVGQLRRAAQQQQRAIDRSQPLTREHFKAAAPEFGKVVFPKVKCDEFAAAIAETIAIRVDPVTFVERGTIGLAVADDDFPRDRIFVDTVVSVVGVAAIIGYVVIAAAVIIAIRAAGAIVIIPAAPGTAIIGIISAAGSIIIPARVVSTGVVSTGSVVISARVVSTRVVSARVVSARVVSASIISACVVAPDIIAAADIIVAADVITARVRFVRVGDVGIVIAASRGVVIIVIIVIVLRRERRHERIDHRCQPHRHHQQTCHR